MEKTALMLKTGSALPVLMISDYKKTLRLKDPERVKISLIHLHILLKIIKSS